MSVWDRFEQMLEKQAPDMLRSFRAPATAKQLENAERLFDIEFPDDLRRAYLRHDGCPADNWRPHTARTPCLFPDAYWCSLERMIEQWQMMKGSTFRAEQAGDPYPPAEAEEAPGWQECEVRQEWWNPCWIPLGLTNTPTKVWCDLIGAPRVGSASCCGTSAWPSHASSLRASTTISRS
jgi:cell wall assembly regulator SMI1